MTEYLAVIFHFCLGTLFLLFGINLILRKGLIASKLLGIQFTVLAITLIISYYLTENNIVIYSSDHPECLSNNEYPMCYVSSHSESFKNILKLDLDWEPFALLMKNRNQGWSTDQKYLFEKVNEFNLHTNNAVLLKRGWSEMLCKRIDRGLWYYDPFKVSEGYYIDSHSLRPYTQHSEEINKLINYLN